MNEFQVSILSVVLIGATTGVFGDLLGQELQSIDHVRAKRQLQNYAQNYAQLNHGPSNIQQLLHAQNSRAPLVNIPPQPIPKLGPSQPIRPQTIPQSQVSQYQPQVTVGNAPQQPIYKKPILPQQPQYRPHPANYAQRPAQPNYNVPQQPQYSSKLPPHIQQLLQFQRSLGEGTPNRV
ncbi:PREDICTED: RNA polymerase II degradation factor 1-like [Dufourea novaeangliae]|uniref:RNA polymerase II degradation factor 1-like n=1 Tax=Dufourea novaeangliae TaxID=178035 RepID=UPI0007671811|nr:PREDICTED: RNA polymerase II degradation factor 1-like [Dufourea novaeangliae]